MKSFLISDNEDTLIGLRLSGIGGVLAKNDDDINHEFDKAVEDKEIGIIILTENIAENINEKVISLKTEGVDQLVVTIPDRSGLKDKNFIMRYIKESIGIKI